MLSRNYEQTQMTPYRHEPELNGFNKIKLITSLACFSSDPEKQQQLAGPHTSGTSKTGCSVKFSAVAIPQCISINPSTGALQVIQQIDAIQCIINNKKKKLNKI